MGLNITCSDGEHVLLRDTNDDLALITVYRKAADRLLIRFPTVCARRDKWVVLPLGTHMYLHLVDGSRVRIERPWRAGGGGVHLKFDAERQVQIVRQVLAEAEIRRFLDDLDTVASF